MAERYKEYREGIVESQMYQEDENITQARIPSIDSEGQIYSNMYQHDKIFPGNNYANDPVPVKNQVQSQMETSNLDMSKRKAREIKY